MLINNELTIWARRQYSKVCPNWESSENLPTIVAAASLDSYPNVDGRFFFLFSNWRPWKFWSGLESVHPSQTFAGRLREYG